MLQPVQVHHPLLGLVCMTCWPRYISNSRKRYIYSLHLQSLLPFLPFTYPIFAYASLYSSLLFEYHSLITYRRTTSLKCRSSVIWNGVAPKIFDRRNTGPQSCWSRKRRKHLNLPERRRTKYAKCIDCAHTNMYDAVLVRLLFILCHVAAYIEEAFFIIASGCLEFQQQFSVVAGCM